MFMKHLHLDIKSCPAQLFAFIFHLFNPLSPHDALKHHFTSPKTDFIPPPPSVLERKFP